MISYKVALSATAAFLAITLLSPLAVRADTRDAIVEIRTDTPSFTWIGAGVIVDDNAQNVVTIATAAHVVTHQGTIRITFRNGPTYNWHGSPTFPRGKDDYALIYLQLPEIDSPYIAQTAQFQPKPAAIVSVIGHPHGATFQTQPAILFTTNIGGPHGPDAVLCSVCKRGDSGGGVFDTNGQLLGIVMSNGRIRGLVSNHEIDSPLLFFYEPIAVSDPNRGF